MSLRVRLLSLFALLCALPAALAQEPMDPPTVELVADGCSCFDLEAHASLEPGIFAADLVFSMDLTGSMGQERAQLIATVSDLVDGLSLLIPDLRLGLVSYRDHPTFVASPVCGYGPATYGNMGDWPYRLELALTADVAAFQAAVAGLPDTGGGSDASEAYSHALLQTATDPAVGWELGRRHVLVDFGDELPHECDPADCVGGDADFSRGTDPGVDGMAGTADDVLMDWTLAELMARSIALIHVNSSGPSFIHGTDSGGVPTDWSYLELWQCWAERTGGTAVDINPDGSTPEHVDLAELLLELIGDQTPLCSSLVLAAEAGYEDWFDLLPAPESDVELPAERDYAYRICVPDGTPLGLHEFELQLLCGGELVRFQSLSVEVTDPCGAGCTDTVEPDLVEGPIDDCFETEADAAAAALAATTASDDSGLPVSLEVEVFGRCPAIVTVTGTDACLNVASTDYVVTIDDEEPLLSEMPPDLVVDCGEVPPMPLVTASDDCDPDPEQSSGELRIDGPCPGTYQLVREWSAADACGHEVGHVQVIDVVDSTPPVIEAGSGGTICLWPPNHRYHCLSLEDFAPVVVTDDCSGPVSWFISDCASDQPDEAPIPETDHNGDGHFFDDCIVEAGGVRVCVRSERAGTHPEGRTYAVSIVAVDACGNLSEAVAIGSIHVPHDQRDKCR